MNALITITPINDEPRNLDTDLAEALGMAEPRKVRQNLIEPNRDELEGYGPLRMQTIQTGGRPSNAFYLNEDQALLVCMFSRTEKAKAIRAEVIRVFKAWRHGEFQPALPNFSNPAEAARAWAVEYEQKQLAIEKQREAEAVALVQHERAEGLSHKGMVV